MNIAFDNLELIPTLLNEIICLKSKIEGVGAKRWYGVDEIADYLGYSKDHIYKLQSSSFIENVHFYKKGGKILFDRVAVDEWVIKGDNTDETLRAGRQAVDRLLSSIKKI